MSADAPVGPLWRKGEGTLKCWGCIAGCGACCYLAPDDRPLDESPSALATVWCSMPNEHTRVPSAELYNGRGSRLCSS